MNLQPHNSRRTSLGIPPSDRVLSGADQNQNGHYPQQVSFVKPEQSAAETEIGLPATNSRGGKQVNRQVHQAQQQLAEIVEMLEQLDQVFEQLESSDTTVDGGSASVPLTGVQEIKNQIRQAQEGMGQLQNDLEIHITDWIHQMQSDHQPEVTIRQTGVASQVMSRIRQQIFGQSGLAVEAQATGIGKELLSLLHP
jgi:flagellin-like hook-associated protein FlgL